MNKSFFIIILLLSSFYNFTIFGMELVPQEITIKDIFRLEDVSQQIVGLLPREDKLDLRLVHKEWALIYSNNKNAWSFMPNDVEKEYDRMIQQQGKSISHLKQTILFSFIFQNNFYATQWIMHNTTINKNIGIIVSGDQYPPVTISPLMIAIHNKNQKMARLLVKIDNSYKNKNWKVHYKTMTVPPFIQQCLYPSHEHDFSFLPYYIATRSNNTATLTQFIQTKIPTDEGIGLLMATTTHGNTPDCCEILLKNEKIKNVIHSNKFCIFTFIIESNNKKIAQKILDHKLYDINQYFWHDQNQKNMTILDYYFEPDRTKKFPHAQNLLQELGAKTYEDIKKINPLNSCIIQ